MIFYCRVEFVPCNQAVVCTVTEFFLRKMFVTFRQDARKKHPSVFSLAATQHCVPPCVTQLSHRHAIQYRTEHCLSYIESQSVHSVTLGGGAVGVGGE